MAPLTYTNRKGFTYFLNRGVTKTGKPRYTFAREPKGEPVEQLPDGYEIEESINGIVSLIKARPQLILPEEVAAVEAALKKHPKGRKYRVAVKSDKIIIYEATGPDIESISKILGSAGIQSVEFSGRLHTEWDRYTQFVQVLRFVLEDAEQRAFSAQRWCYLGSIDDWIYAGHSGKIETLARKLVPILGTDAFYQLY